MIEIWQPRWKDRKVLIAKFKVREGVNEIRFTKAPSLGTDIFRVNSEVIRACPIGSNGKLDCYEVPLDSVVGPDYKLTKDE